MTAKTRDEIRGAIFASENMKPETVEIDFLGTKIEIRQPNLGAILSISTGEDRRDAMVNMLITYAFVPGTDEQVFEEADKANLLLIPFGKDFQRLQKAITALTDVNLLTSDSEKKSGAAPISST